jgi:hypothetical protein
MRAGQSRGDTAAQPTLTSSSSNPSAWQPWILPPLAAASRVSCSTTAAAHLMNTSCHTLSPRAYTAGARSERRSAGGGVEKWWPQMWNTDEMMPRTLVQITCALFENAARQRHDR